jgi:hypothetical protein
MITAKETGPFGIWMAWDDYFWNQYDNHPTGYGTSREQALGSLSRALTQQKLRTTAPEQKARHQHNWTPWTRERMCKNCFAHEWRNSY